MRFATVIFVSGLVFFVLLSANGNGNLMFFSFTDYLSRDELCYVCDRRRGENDNVDET